MLGRVLCSGGKPRQRPQREQSLDAQTIKKVDRTKSDGSDSGPGGKLRALAGVQNKKGKDTKEHADPTNSADSIGAALRSRKGASHPLRCADRYNERILVALASSENPNRM